MKSVFYSAFSKGRDIGSIKENTMKRIIASAVLILASSQVFAIGNLADISVVDRHQQRTLRVYWHEGRAYVEGKPGNEYQIVVRNQLAQDVLAVVSVDGVNVVTGETAAASQGGYVIDQWHQLDVAGWRKSLSRTAAFYFTELPDSYAARTGRGQNVGVIGAAIYRRKADVMSYDVPNNDESEGRSMQDRRERSEKNAAGELNAPSAKGAPSASMQSRAAPIQEKKLGTGHGRSETSNARSVNFERATSSPEEVVTIYYDSRTNLIARGVIRENRWQREPQPFPAGFVPDPPRHW